MINKISGQLLEKFINEIKKEENMERINNDIINPIIYNFLKKIYPYILIISLICVLTLILAILILIFLIKNSYKISSLQ